MLTQLVAFVLMLGQSYVFFFFLVIVLFYFFTPVVKERSLVWHDMSAESARSPLPPLGPLCHARDNVVIFITRA